MQNYHLPRKIMMRLANYKRQRAKSNEVIRNENIYELEKMEIEISSDDEEKETNKGEFVNQNESVINLWHKEEIMEDKEMFIKRKIEEYIKSFTVHGLTKVFTGSKIESIFWSTMLLGGILLSIIICHGLVSKYLRYGVYTEIRSQITDQNFFPSITFCESQLLIDTYFSYCGVAPRIRHKNTTIICEKRYYNKYANITSKKNQYWSNQLYNMTKCETWGGKHCANDKYFRSLKRFNNSCITWNYKGDLHDIYSHVDIEFTFTSPSTLNVQPVIMAIPHDPEIYEIDITNKVDIEPLKYYEIKLDKTLIKRLPFPYPSNCTNSKMGDIFLGKYTRRSCIESHNYIEMYKHCGDILDYMRQYIPKDIFKFYQKNLTIQKAEECIWWFGQGETRKPSGCMFPCEDLDLDITSTFHERGMRKKSNNTYSISIQYQRVDTYKVMEEKALYKWDQMACEIGGLIGLVIGASVISLVEIFAYLFLCCLEKLKIK